MASKIFTNYLTPSERAAFDRRELTPEQEKKILADILKFQKGMAESDKHALYAKL